MQVFKLNGTAKAIALVLASTTYTQSSHAEVDIYGFAAARLGTVDAGESWLEGGFGRFDVGDEGSDEFAVGDVQVALDWHATDSLLFHAHVGAYAESAASSVEEVGLVEAYARYQVVDSGSNSFAFSVGQKFFPTSLENTDDLWQSPYTLTYSAWNSWIAHEFRPIGVEFSYNHFLENGATIGLRGVAMIGNDSSGAELAWGGWRLSQRLTFLGEVLPLPDLVTLRDGGLFEDQRDDGSKPFGPDLDDDVGGAIQLRFSKDAVKARFTYADNNGDEALWRGEYAWRTRFSLLGVEWQVNENLVLVSELASGDTRMGPPNMGVDVDFDTGYLLASYVSGNHRFTGRYDYMDIEDRDGLVTDNSENGDGYTFAYFYSTGSWRVGAEYSSIDIDRPAAFQSGFDPDNDGDKFTLEFRYTF